MGSDLGTDCRKQTQETVANKGASIEMCDFKEVISWVTRVVAVLQQVREFELQNRCE